MIDVIETTTGYDVAFQYKPWLVDAIKQIPGARWNPPKKKWFVPTQSGGALLRWASTFKGTSISSNKNQPMEIGEIEELPELEVEIPLLREMFPYQKRGVAYALKTKRLIVGDQPGLGKTGQAIATMVGADAKCILVICPATLRENWKREWQIWTGKDSMVLSDKNKNTWYQYFKVGYCNVFIANYESLKKYFVQDIVRPLGKDGKPAPLRLNHIKFKESINLFDAVIIDEVHRCKDGKTQQSKFVMGICKGKEWVLALTGTPVVNKPMDLIPQLHIINRLQDFGNYNGFINTYCQGVNGASNLKQLNYLMHKTCFYRREKTEVLKDLPAKMRNIVRVDISNRAEYNKAENDFVEYLRVNLEKSEDQIDAAMRGQIMVQMGILKRISARGKVDDMIEHINEVVEAGEKIVVFAWHKEMVQELKAAIPNAVTIVGDDSMEERQRAVDNFQNDPKTQVILCNIKSGGVGITLTASSRVAFIELPWHPADCEQCEDRCHRIGQLDSVQCTYFLGHETIDKYIYSIIEKKRAIVNQVTGAEDNIETNMVDEFINLFKSKRL
jgi:SWI/SNF-related matrix-associated actin-dependent regulator 1 of chromatin subfamily A